MITTDLLTCLLGLVRSGYSRNKNNIVYFSIISKLLSGFIIYLQHCSSVSNQINNYFLYYIHLQLIKREFNILVYILLISI